MAQNPHLSALAFVRTAFDRSTACLEEEDASFAPTPGMFTTAQQIAHTAQVVDWFREGAFRPEGFDLDFEAIEKQVRAVKTLGEARRRFADAMTRLGQVVAETSPEELAVPIADGPIMGGEPRHVIVPAFADHTAHHRGALTTYARLRGRTPAMPYE